MSNVELQLDLFEGQILTTEQENTVREFIDSKEKAALSRADYIKRLEETLKEAGFKRSQYVNDFKIVTRQNEQKSFGYGSNQFTTEVTYKDYTGGIALKYNYFCTSSKTLKNRYSMGYFRKRMVTWCL